MWNLLTARMRHLNKTHDDYDMTSVIKSNTTVRLPKLWDREVNEKVYRHLSRDRVLSICKNIKDNYKLPILFFSFLLTIFDDQ